MLKKRMNLAKELAFLLIILLFLSTKAWAVPEMHQAEITTGTIKVASLYSHQLELTAPASLSALDANEASYVPPKAKLEKVLKEIEKDPYFDQDIASTYHPEGCLEFLQAVCDKAGLEVSELVKKSIQISEPYDGDLIKISSSVYYGLPHWGIYYHGLVYHNWSSFRADPYQYFITRYSLPSSPIIVLHSVLKNPNSLTSLFR